MEITVKQAVLKEVTVTLGTKEIISIISKHLLVKDIADPYYAYHIDQGQWWKDDIYSDGWISAGRATDEDVRKYNLIKELEKELGNM